MMFFVLTRLKKISLCNWDVIAFGFMSIALLLLAVHPSYMSYIFGAILFLFNRVLFNYILSYSIMRKEKYFVFGLF